MRGDSFEPQAWCAHCRYELFQQEPHVCGLPAEGTAAWVDPRLEQSFFAARQRKHREANLGDVTRRPQTRRERFPGYNASLGGHSLTEEEFTRMAAFSASFGPPPPAPPKAKVVVTIKRDVPVAPIALGPGPKMLMLLAKNPPHPDE